MNYIVSLNADKIGELRYGAVPIGELVKAFSEAYPFDPAEIWRKECERTEKLPKITQTEIDACHERLAAMEGLVSQYGAEPVSRLDVPDDDNRVEALRLTLSKWRSEIIREICGALERDRKACLVLERDGLPPLAVPPEILRNHPFGPLEVSQFFALSWDYRDLKALRYDGATIFVPDEFAKAALATLPQPKAALGRPFHSMREPYIKWFTDKGFSREGKGPKKTMASLPEIFGRDRSKWPGDQTIRDWEAEAEKCAGQKPTETPHGNPG